MKLLIVILTVLNFSLMGNVSESAPTTLNLKFYHEGYYRSDLDRMIKTFQVTVSLYRSNSPYNLITSSIANIDVNGNSSVSLNIPIDTTYYIGISGWNLLGVRSSIAPRFNTNQTTSYDFSAAGNKSLCGQEKIDDLPARWGIYVGNMNQNGWMDAGDLIPIDNDYSVYATGNLITDLTGDGIVDSDDLMLCARNVSYFLVTCTL